MDKSTFAQRNMTAKVTKAEITKYKKLLSRHDWFYPFAEDYSAWKAGSEQWAEIDGMQKRVDPDWSIFNEYAPEACKVKRK